MQTQNESSNSINKGNQKISTAVSVGSFLSKKGATKGTIEILFAGASAYVVYLVGAIVLVVLMIIALFSVLNPATFLTKEEPEEESIVSSLSGAYSAEIQKVSSYLIEVLNSNYGCNATIDELTYNEESGTFVLSNKYAEISVDFYPRLNEFAEQIDSYANAVNGLINLYQADEEAVKANTVDVSIESKMTEDGELTDYGEEFVDNLDSEYQYSQDDTYFKSLKEYSNVMFSYEDDISKWKFENFRRENRIDTKIDCYRSTMNALQREPVSCEIYHDIEEKSEVKTMVTMGNVTVYMNVDPTVYKKDIYENVIEIATGGEMYKETTFEDGTKQVQKVVLDAEEAKDVVETILDTYYYSYLSLYTDYDYVIGYSGKVTSSDWDYGNIVNAGDSETISKYWEYSKSKSEQLHNLPYKTDNGANGPAMNNQCTQFAATFFLDVYGFAALRGDGVNVVDNLVKDCGEDSNAPVKFARAMSVAPGAIVSLYPNHVIVIDEVDDDGTIYISEGNYDNGKIRIHQKYGGGLTEYQRETKTWIKAMAIPIENQFEKEE